MKTWEMIKELTENPDKKFKLKGEENTVYVSDREIEGGIDLIDVDFITIDDEWEEIKKPVDFMTAIASGKRIKVEHDILPKGSWVTKLSELDGFIDDLGAYCSSDIREILLHGKWYIED